MQRVKFYAQFAPYTGHLRFIYECPFSLVPRTSTGINISMMLQCFWAGKPIRPFIFDDLSKKRALRSLVARISMGAMLKCIHVFP